MYVIKWRKTIINVVIAEYTLKFLQKKSEIQMVTEYKKEVEALTIPKLQVLSGFHQKNEINLRNIRYFSKLEPISSKKIN